MPQDPDTPNPDAAPMTPPEDNLTDALLREYARAGRDPDETFVTNVESALDSDSDDTAPDTDSKKIVPIPATSSIGVSPWWRIAAAIVALAGTATGFAIWTTARQHHADLAAAASQATTLREQAASRNAELHEHAEKLAANAKSVTEELMERERSLEAAAQKAKEDRIKIANLESELGEMKTDLKNYSAISEKAGSTSIDVFQGELERLRTAATTPTRDPSRPAPGASPAPHPKPTPAPSPAPAPARPSPGAAATITTGSGYTGATAVGGIARAKHPMTATMFGRDASPAPADSFADAGGRFNFSIGYEFDGLEETDHTRGFDYRDPDAWRYAPPTDRERYGELVDNRWESPWQNPLSTFSIDVDTASYTNLRRMINDGVSPIPKDAVRIEEMINYFSYHYPKAEGKHPFAFAIESAECPWNDNHRLVRVGLKAREIERDTRPSANLVFLLDVSGSMDSDDKLPLVRKSMKMLVKELHADDKVAIAVYAGAQGLVLPPTPVGEQETILGALSRLDAGGSTNGGAGIELAYKLATENFIEDGVNRVILCTDGDFNVGTTSQGELVDLVKERAQGGVFLSVLGFGDGNINDAMLEAITNKGNGTYYYIDSIAEARKVFLEDLMATLVTVAKDVKFQLEFNPALVQGYRLVGYANRMLRAEDFEDDTVDAGETGAGHRVTALYEIIPAEIKSDTDIKEAPDLKYQRPPKVRLIDSEEMLTVKLRYKQPDGDTSQLLEVPVKFGDNVSWQEASTDLQFASSVALFGMLLRECEHLPDDITFEDVLELAAHGTGEDPKGRRKEFRDLVRQHRATR